MRTTTTLTISKRPYYSSGMFGGAATEENAKITINYTSETSDLVDSMIANKSENSNVVKGELVS